MVVKCNTFLYNVLDTSMLIVDLYYAFNYVYCIALFVF